MVVRVRHVSMYAITYKQRLFNTALDAEQTPADVAQAVSKHTTTQTTPQQKQHS
eukprot:m.512152 g.512152  ORF g.512152 m.512152 type:complete len:54 (+) comp104021_c0_seq1:43-204(+)